MNALPAPRIEALSSVRFFAALLVLLFHLHARGLVPGPIEPIARNGYMAVGFFFVLSGFVLSLGDSQSPGRFWWKRFARLYPLYLVALVIAPEVSSSSWEQDVWARFASVFMLQAWDPARAQAFNSPAWSLSVEAFFYLLFPVVIAVASRLASRALVVTIALSCVAALIGPIAHQVSAAETAHVHPSEVFSTWSNLVRFAPPVHLPLFVAGVAAGVLHRRGARLPRPGLVSLIGACVITGGLVSDSPGAYFLLHNGALAPAYLAVIFGLAQGVARPLRWRVFTVPGDASYAIYILHITFIFYTLVGLRALGVDPIADPSHRPLSFVPLVGIPVLGALVAWSVIERPVNRALRRVRIQYFFGAGSRPVHGSVAALEPRGPAHGNVE